MRVTPNTIVSPAAMMNSDEALASPFSACTKRKERSGTRWPRYCIPSPRAFGDEGRGEGQPRAPRARVCPSPWTLSPRCRGEGTAMTTTACARPSPRPRGTGIWRRPRTSSSSWCRPCPCMVVSPTQAPSVDWWSSPRIVTGPAMVSNFSVLEGRQQLVGVGGARPCRAGPSSCSRRRSRAASPAAACR